MAHFAEMQNGSVARIIVVDNKDCGGGDYPESEPVGQAFIASIGLPGTWLQCSYNATFRGRYPAIGDTYDADEDEFVSATEDAE
jgi:hypothetical protein